MAAPVWFQHWAVGPVGLWRFLIGTRCNLWAAILLHSRHQGRSPVSWPRPKGEPPKSRRVSGVDIRLRYFRRWKHENMGTNSSKSGAATSRKSLIVLVSSLPQDRWICRWCQALHYPRWENDRGGASPQVFLGRDSPGPRQEANWKSLKLDLGTITVTNWIRSPQKITILIVHVLFTAMVLGVHHSLRFHVLSSPLSSSFKTYENPGETCGCLTLDAAVY